MRELIAQAEALDKLCRHPFSATARANDVLDVAQRMKMELRAKAEQPAEQGEPVAHGFAPNGDGKITDALVVGHNYDPEYNIPLYRIPDPRIAALEADLEQAVQMYTDAAGERDKALADLAAAQASATPVVSHELWWLIEASDGAALYATLEDDGAWTRDVYKAARFPTEKSAKFVMHQCHLWDRDRNGGYSVTKVYVAEHMFLHESCGQKDK